MTRRSNLFLTDFLGSLIENPFEMQSKIGELLNKGTKHFYVLFNSLIVNYILSNNLVLSLIWSDSTGYCHEHWSFFLQKLQLSVLEYLIWIWNQATSE